jgi:peptidoglycan/LPS O-acetylase OafA/YrhL
VAVLAVVLYHFGVSWAPGGFIGVDVFFVLSGYLITTLLLLEHDRTGGIALRSFWGRRARRLLPALIVTLVGVSAYSAFVATAPERSTLRGDELASLFYVANWHFIVSHASYFQAFGPASPLRHMWSLAIEEQWYLVWPVVVALCLRVSRRRLCATSVVLLVVSAGLAFALYHPLGDPSRVYFGTDTRAQALLVGAVLAFIVPRLRGRTHLVGWLGLAAVAVLVAELHDSSAHLYRGGLTVVALVAAALVAGATSDRRTPLVRVLEWSPLVALGTISYGVYLFHWPVALWLTSARTGQHGVALFALRSGVTLLVAVLSFLLIEQPVRQHRWRVPRFAVPVAIGSVAALVLVSTAGAESWASYYGVRGRNTKAIDPRLPTVLIVGDSVGFTLGFNVYGRQSTAGANWRTSAMIGCGIMEGDPIVNGRRGAPPAVCGHETSTWSEAVKRYHPDLVLGVFGRWEVDDHVLAAVVRHPGDPAFNAVLRADVDRAKRVLSAGGAKVVFLDVPCYGETAPGQAQGQMSRVDAVNRVFASSVPLVHWSAFLCPGGRYLDKRHGVVVRKDGTHFDIPGAIVTWNWLGPQIVRLAAQAKATH